MLERPFPSGILAVLLSKKEKDAVFQGEGFWENNCAFWWSLGKGKDLREEKLVFANVLANVLV